MAIGSALKGMGSNLAGALGYSNKCVLMIKYDGVEHEDHNEAEIAPVQQAGGLLGKVAAVAGAAKAAAGKVAGAANAALGAAAGLLGFAGDAGYVTLQMQYNPSSLSMTSSNGSIVNSSVSGAGDAMYNQLNLTARTTLNVELIFDDTNLHDAFSTESITTLSGAASLGKELIGAALTKESASHSIAKYVDALTSAMYSDSTRKVIFVWGSTSFKGELTNVDPQYTMFNKSGDPIRARVSISIFQGSAHSNDKEYWYAAYKECGYKLKKD